jgi:hypothetical protein
MWTPPGPRLLRKYMCWNEPSGGEFKRRFAVAKELRYSADRKVTARTDLEKGNCMTSISANVHINGVSTQAMAASQTAEHQQAKQAEPSESGGVLRLGSDTSKVGGGAQAQSAQGSGGSGDSTVEQLREMIKELQKQLAEEQKQLAQLMASKMDESAKAAAVAAKQASIATITGQLLIVTGKLLEALQQSGGSSAGGVISTQA